MLIFEIALPLRNFKRLYHVGSMDVSHKGSTSYEGAGLSVSEHPSEWAQIARLGDTIWELTKPDNKFLNLYRLGKKQKQTITKWGIGENLVEPCTVYRLTWFDPDDEEDRYMEFTSREEAEEEADDVMYEDANPRITEHTSGLRAAPSLMQRTRLARIDDTSLAFDVLSTVYVEDAMPGIDGVWWADRLDVHALSAPRGVIVPKMLPTWTVRQVR